MTNLPPGWLKKRLEKASLDYQSFRNWAEDWAEERLDERIQKLEREVERLKIDLQCARSHERYQLQRAEAAEKRADDAERCNVELAKAGVALRCELADAKKRIKEREADFERFQQAEEVLRKIRADVVADYNRDAAEQEEEK